VFDRGDAEEKERVRDLMKEMIREAAKEGSGEHRTHLLPANQVAETHSWGRGH